MVKKILFIVSLAFNGLFLLVLVFSLSRSASVLTFLSLETKGTPYLQNAIIAGVPAEQADMTFGAVEFSLKKGSEATLQFSLVRKGRQSNLALEPLYDHAVIAVEQSGFGLVIRGIAPGEAVLQLFSAQGFRNIARVTVYE